ncbi:MAG: hypothetical protein ACLQNE_31295 [Thermoguttaceae bacterium]
MSEEQDKGGDKAFLNRWGEVNDQLRLLEGKDDKESNERRLDLLEELMCMDMAMGDYRRAMIQASKKRGAQPGERSTPSQGANEGGKG